MNKATIEKLKRNPHYKPTPKQLIADEEIEQVKTFGVLPKHPTGPKVRTYKKPLDKQES